MSSRARIRRRAPGRKVANAMWPVVVTIRTRESGEATAREHLEMQTAMTRVSAVEFRRYVGVDRIREVLAWLDSYAPGPHPYKAQRDVVQDLGDESLLIVAVCEVVQ